MLIARGEIEILVGEEVVLPDLQAEGASLPNVHRLLPTFSKIPNTAPGIQNLLRDPSSLVVRCFPAMEQPPAAEAVLSQLRRHSADWQQRYHLKAIGLFGSVARGEQRPGSDIDIWVELEPLTPFALVHLKQELNALLPAPVDVVRLRKRMNPTLRQRIEREGVAA